MTETRVLRELEQHIRPLEDEVLNAPVQPTLSINRTFRPADYRWSKNETRCLIDLYSTYRKKVGTFHIRNIKMMWQIITDELQKLDIIVTPNNCVNRWKVLERSYKKCIDDQNKTGRGRKYFEYETEMSLIFGRKKNVHPEMLLNSDTTDYHLLKENVIDESDKDIEISAPQMKIIDTPSTSGNQVEKTKIKFETPIKKPRFRKNKISTLENIRIDRKWYYEERLKIEKEKLEEIKKRNKLIEERNQILKQNKCNCNCNSLL